MQNIRLLQPIRHADRRGFFSETWNKRDLIDMGITTDFVQDNHSISYEPGTLRGLHFQLPPYAQAKLVRCIEGNILDVAVDIRRGSNTYGQHVSVNLSGKNKRQLYIPRGFAHGFLVLSDFAVFAYKVDNLYAPEYEDGILWSDSSLNIKWSLNESDIIVSEKDANLPFFSELDSPFDN